jgi:exodeoxyribonuclease VII small subunit
MPQQKGAERPDQAPAETSQVASELAGLSFEESLEKLEGVVDSLENGDLELEDSLQAFEQGVRLSARCSEQLASAEQRIETLTREGGNWVSRPFDPIETAIETPTGSATAGSSDAHGEEAS